MPLTATTVSKIKPREKDYKLSDEKGLYLFITSKGAKYWRLKYRFLGKEKKLALGVYPDISLKDARDKRDSARKLLSNGIDPAIEKQNTKQSNKAAIENSFEAIAREWHAKYTDKWTQGHGERILD